MHLFLSALTTSAVNLAVFSTVPLLWWVLRWRRETGFLPWIGLIRPRLRKPWWVLALFLAAYYFFYSFDFTVFIRDASMQALESSGSVSASAYAGLGAAAVLPALTEAFLANGAAEEILFQGFLCKRLCGRLGTVGGVAVQAVLFGLMHNLLYLAAGIPVGLDYHVWMFLFTGAGAALLGGLNEGLCNGSIWPGILLHGAGNFLSSLLVTF